MHCTLVYRLCVIERLKWEESHANAADRDDRVESVRNRVYSIIYRCSICAQFVGVHLLLLRVNRACKTNTSVTVHHNLDEPLETAVVEQSGLRVVHCSSLTGLAVRLVVRGLLVPRWSALVWLFDSSLLHRWSIAGPSAGLAVALLLVHRWSIAGPSAGLAVALSLVHRWCITGPSAGLAVPLSLVHRWSVCWSGCCSVPRASRVRLLVHRWSICWSICWSGCSSVTRASLVFLLDRLFES